MTHQTKAGTPSASNIDKGSFARLVFDVGWRSEEAEHREIFLARRANIWRDIFPPGLEERLLGGKPGESVEVAYGPGESVPPFRESSLLSRDRRDFQSGPGRSLEPRFGRFYPKGFLTNVLGIFPENTYPFRVVGLDQAAFEADLNHPLARFPLTVRVSIQETSRKAGDVGGRCATWMEDILDRGPGMQARWQGRPTDFWASDGFRREDERDDAEFHRRPRLVNHVDAQASAFIQEAYAARCRPGLRVLDLMSSVASHLPPDEDLEVVGLGMNREELEANPRLQDHLVQDLNADPALPFAQGSFDLAVCSLSIEYLVQPLAVMREIRRVLVPGGHCLISFSNRWHPPKAIALWTELNEFERLGLVQEYFLQAGGFEAIRSSSRRNWWRPETDRLAGQLPASDPVFTVEARAAAADAQPRS